jgi:uncharacterized protein (DUF305 family)
MMNSKLLNAFRTAMLVPLTALSLATAAQAQTAKPMSPSASMPMGDMHSGAGGSADMKQSMMSGMDGMQKMQMSGDTDKDFAMMMKIHHQGAVDMAQMELAHGKSPVMKAMAKNIIAAQKKEIAQFDRWLATQK